jgi:beta-lactamase regulating signal transducer with metallopeptidase domain
MTMERTLIEYLANALWQIPLLAFGVWLLLRAVKASPLAQHYLWLATLAFAVLLPALGIRQPVAPVSTQAGTFAVAEQPAPAPQPVTLSPSVSRQAESRWPRAAAQLRGVRLTPIMAHSLTAFYLAVVFFGFVRIAIAWRAARGLVQHSHPVALLPRHIRVLSNISQRLRVAVPGLRESISISSPVIVGLSAPVLLLPQEFFRHTEDEIEAALCHELAHLRRHDYLINLFCQIASLPVAWHPATHAVQQRIRRTREMVCDAIAAHQMCSEIKYAKCLVALAQSVLHRQAMDEPAQALGLFNRNTLEERIMSLMEKKNALSLRARLARAAAGAMVIAATLLLASLVHIAPVMAESVQLSNPAPQAQDSVSAPLPAPSPASKPSAAVSPATSASHNAAKIAKQSASAEPDATSTNPSSELTPKERAEQRSEDALDQLRSAGSIFKDGEFKLQMEDLRRQLAETRAVLSSPEFRKQIAEALQRRKAFAAHHEEFEKQMAEFRKQLQSGEFQKQIARAQRQAADAALHSEDFRKEMAEFQKQFQNGEFKHEMERAAQELKEAHEQWKNNFAQPLPKLPPQPKLPPLPELPPAQELPRLP